MFLDPPVTTGRRRAATGALHAVVAWPLLAIAEVLVGMIGLGALDDPDFLGVGGIFMLLLVAPVSWGVYAWPVVVAVAAGVAALNPGGRPARTGWIVAAAAVVLVPAVYAVLLLR